MEKKGHTLVVEGEWMERDNSVPLHHQNPMRVWSLKRDVADVGVDGDDDAEMKESMDLALREENENDEDRDPVGDSNRMSTTMRRALVGRGAGVVEQWSDSTVMDKENDCSESVD